MKAVVKSLRKDDYYKTSHFFMETIHGGDKFVFPGADSFRSIESWRKKASTFNQVVVTLAAL